MDLFKTRIESYCSDILPDASFLQCCSNVTRYFFESDASCEIDNQCRCPGGLVTQTEFLLYGFILLSLGCIVLCALYAVCACIFGRRDVQIRMKPSNVKYERLPRF